jgi:hypothetical protein
MAHNKCYFQSLIYLLKRIVYNLGHLHLPTFTSLACLFTPQDAHNAQTNNNKIMVWFIFRIRKNVFKIKGILYNKTF